MNFMGHLSTILAHKREVRRNCFKAGLYWQGITHDWSKYSPVEFWRGVRYFQGDRSPNDAERRATGKSRAWLHHKGRNRHHLEYWIDYGRRPDGTIGMTGMEMPLRYVGEMVCDRIAASKIYQKEKYTQASPYEYYMHSRDHYMLHPATRALLEKLMIMVRDEGEDAAFRYIRENMRGGEW